MAAPTQGTRGTLATDPATGAVVGCYNSAGILALGATNLQQADQIRPPTGTAGGNGNTAMTASTGTVPTSVGTGTQTDGTGTPTGTDGTSAMTGYASNFANLPLGETIYDNPGAVYNHLLNTPEWQAIFGPSNGSSPLNQALQDVPYDPLSMWAMTVGATDKGIAGGDTGSYANFLADMVSNQLQPGGQGWDFGELMNNIFSASSDGSAGGANNSVLNNLLTSGSGPQQVSNVYNMTRDAARAGLNPLAAQASLTSMKQAGDDYLTNYIQGGTNTPFNQWIGQNRPDLASAFTMR